jgi:hypothetical protein
MKLPAASCGVSRAELRRSITRLRSHELRRGRLAIPLCSKLQSALATAKRKLHKNPATRFAGFK